MSRRPLGAAVIALASLLIATPAVAQDTNVNVEVRNPGDEPRAELRYAWTEGLTGTTVLESDTIVTTLQGGQPVSEEQALLTRTVSRTVTEVDENGTARVEFSVEAPERQGLDIPAGEAVEDVGGEGVETLQAALASLSSYSGWMELDSRGALLDYGVDGMADATAALLVETRGLGGEVIVLPEEPVGVGAEWETYTEVYEARLDFESESITRLVASDGNSLSLEQETFVLQQPNLGLERLAISAGAIYMTQELEGSADIELALDSLVPTGTGEAVLSVVTGTSAGGYGAELQTIYEMALTSSEGE